MLSRWVRICSMILTVLLIGGCSWVMSDPLAYPDQEEPIIDMKIPDPPDILPEVFAGEDFDSYEGGLEAGSGEGGGDEAPEAGEVAGVTGGAEGP